MPSNEELNKDGYNTNNENKNQDAKPPEKQHISRLNINIAEMQKATNARNAGNPYKRGNAPNTSSTVTNAPKVEATSKAETTRNNIQELSKEIAKEKPNTPTQDIDKEKEFESDNLSLWDSDEENYAETLANEYHNTFEIQDGTSTNKSPKQPQNAKQRRGIKEFLKAKFPLILIGFFVILIAYFLINIYLWYFSGDSQEKILTQIQDEQVTGVEVSDDSIGKSSKEKYPFVKVDFSKLQRQNPEVVAWLKVGAVDIDMPIVQTDNNDYYLNHDVNRQQNSLGWVFVDTRCNLDFLGMNTVLYGHNLTNQQMFGTLKDLFKVDPERKKQDEIIQFTTQSQQMVFQITSVYVTDYKDWKYVQQGFQTLKQKQDFINRMQKKNEMPLFHRDDLSVNDQFITFSTCYGPAGTTQRLVVHARLIAQKDNY